MSRYLDNIPEPWSVDNIRSAIMHKFMDARLSIEETEGGQLWQAIKELDDTVWIFKSSVEDLFQIISLFAQKTQDPGFWEATNRTNAEHFAREVKRKLFYSTTSVMALVEVSRVFHQKYPVGGFTEKLGACFSTPGLHKFLQDLRNYNSHWRIAEANWRIDYDFEKGSRIARFVVTREDLLAWGRWTSAARAFIESSDKFIDVGATLAEYAKQVKAFYEWHKGVVLVSYAEILKRYFEYKRIHDGLNRRMSWNMILGHLPQGLNPFQYLARYLEPEQIEKIMSFELGSEAQIQALISTLDMERFCDAQLIDKVRKLFQPPVVP